MQSTVQVPSVTHGDKNASPSSSDHNQIGVSPVAASSAKVLLVGQETSWGMSFLRSLERLGSKFSFALPLRVTSHFAKDGQYDVVVIDTTVPPALRKEIASILLGSNASMFYAHSVENGCWWVPAVIAGRDCHGSPAFRTKTFLKELERLLVTSL